MNRYTCPKCGAQLVTFWQKTAFGAKNRKCKECGTLVGLAFVPNLLAHLVFAFTPFFTAVLALDLAFSPELMNLPSGITTTLLVFVLGMLAPVPALMWIFVRVVPLVEKPPNRKYL